VNEHAWSEFASPLSGEATCADNPDYKEGGRAAPADT
jgi:hypothetical protein